ncbi:Uncharacterised protein at_DN2622 [Pycnogonum litorale]
MNLSKRQFVSKFIEELAKESKNVGLELKESETWSSSCLFEYSKIYHYQGAEVSCGLKLASKIANEANDGLPTLSNKVSSISSAGVAVAGADPYPMMAYLLMKMELCTLLDVEFSLQINELGILAVFPRQLGGLPIVNYAGYCLRGVIDPLTIGLSVLKTAYERNSDLWPILSKLCELIPSHH